MKQTTQIFLPKNILISRFELGYRFSFNGKEKDNETYGDGNTNDYGARIYNPRLGSWFSIDPFQNKYPYLSPYNYTADNPIWFIDPDGKKIIVPNVADREPILRMINSRARGTFAFNNEGVLYQVEAEGKKGYSEFYRDRLVQAIEKEDVNISIKISDKVTYNGTTKDGKPYEKTKDVRDFGGGTTFGKEGENQQIVLDGKDYNTSGSDATNNVVDVNGKSLKQEAADIAMHEILGHGIPKILNESKGKDAVKEENKAREQLSPGRNTMRGGSHPSNKDITEKKL